MNILITGICGQLGNRLSEILTNMKINHMGIGRDETYQTKVPYLCEDLTFVKKEKLSNFIKSATHVIHFADVINDSTDFEKDLPKQFENCCLNTIKLINCLPSTIQHFSFGSSVSVYGSPKELPLSENSDIHPENIYSFCKASTENYINMFGSKSNIPISILRISSIYGPGAKKENQYRSVPNMINTILSGKEPYVSGDGSTFRDYMYIDDCIKATINASLLKADGTFNIASGRGTSIMELATEIISISGEDVELENRYDMDREWSSVCDINKMESELDYTPEYSISDGLKLTYEWHKGNV